MLAQLDILYVDDEPCMRRLVREAFAESAIPTRVRGVESGEEALEVLGSERRSGDGADPDLVLLDKDLGEESGLDLLAELRGRVSHEASVVVFTGSDDPADVERAYERGANAFVQKPRDFEGLVSFARGAAIFWRPSPAVGASA